MDDHEADGWAILHDRSALPSSEYETFYLFGPLPTKEVADLIESSAECACRRSVVPIFFPKGVTMMLAAVAGVPTSHDEPIH